MHLLLPQSSWSSRVEGILVKARGFLTGSKAAAFQLPSMNFSLYNSGSQPCFNTEAPSHFKPLSEYSL